VDCGHGCRLPTLRTTTATTAARRTENWLPEGHLANFIGDSADSLGLNACHARYAKGGPRAQPLHPAVIVKVLYATPQAPSTWASWRLSCTKSWPRDDGRRELSGAQDALGLSGAAPAKSWRPLLCSSCTLFASAPWASWARWPCTAPSARPRRPMTWRRMSPTSTSPARSSAEPIGWPKSWRKSCPWSHGSKRPMPLGGPTRTIKLAPRQGWQA
jgi:hypothetical protein